MAEQILFDLLRQSDVDGELYKLYARGYANLCGVIGDVVRWNGISDTAVAYIMQASDLELAPKVAVALGLMEAAPQNV